MNDRQIRRRRGRRTRAESQSTRTRILDTARKMFSERGYSGTSMRAIAAAAGVDASLINHYFGDKPGLLIAIMELPVDPLSKIRGVLQEGLDGAGFRLVYTFITTWDPYREVFAMLLRSAFDESSVIFGIAEQAIIPQLHDALHGPDRVMRASLIAAEVLGLASMRYVVASEPIASADPDRIAGLYGPAIQQLLDPA